MIIEMKPVESSLIAAIGYDGDSGELRVQFRRGGTTYVYNTVQHHVHHNLMEAKSVGKFFLGEIKGTYLGKKLEEKP